MYVLMCVYVTRTYYVHVYSLRTQAFLVHVVNCVWANKLKLGKALAQTSRKGRHWGDAALTCPLAG